MEEEEEEVDRDGTITGTGDTEEPLEGELVMRLERLELLELLEPLELLELL